MDTKRVWQLLERGGVVRPVASVVQPGDQAASRGWQPSKYETLADPIGADELGRLLAQRARQLGADRLLIWEDPQDIALGHVVGRELKVPVVRSFNMDGLVGHSGSLPQGARVLLLLDAVREAAPLRAMTALVHQQGASVVGTAVLVETQALVESGVGTGEVVALVSGRDAQA